MFFRLEQAKSVFNRSSLLEIDQIELGDCRFQVLHFRFRTSGRREWAKAHPRFEPPPRRSGDDRGDH